MTQSALPKIALPGLALPGVGVYRIAPPTLPATDPSEFARSVTWGPQVTSRLDGGSLADDVPLETGRIIESIETDTQASLDITVPRRADGRDWSPGMQPGHPLARYGQTLDVAVHAGPLGANPDVYDVGSFQVLSWAEADDRQTVSVTGQSSLAVLRDAHPESPLAVRDGGTLASESLRITAGIAPMVIDAGLTDRAVPESVAWGEDRLAALREIAQAWPARLRVDASGTILMLPPLPEVPTPMWRLHDGQGGVVVSAPRQDTRDGAPNVVIARSRRYFDEDTPAGELPSLQATARVTVGPARWDGPYGQVVEEWSNDLLGGRDTRMDAAVARLREAQRNRQVLTVRCVRDPRILIDDPVEIRTSDGGLHWGYVVAREMGLVAQDAEMTLEVGVG